MPSTPAIDLAVQRMLGEQLCQQLVSSALPEDAAGPYASLFAQTLADAIAPASKAGSDTKAAK